MAYRMPPMWGIPPDKLDAFFAMQDKGYVPAQPDAYKTGLNQKDNSQRVYDPASDYWWYPNQAINPGAWEDLGYNNSGFNLYNAAQLVAGAGLGLGAYNIGTALAAGAGGAGAAAPAVGASSMPMAGGVGGGVGSAAGGTAAWAPAQLAATTAAGGYNASIPWMAQLAEAGALGASGLTAAEMQALGVSDLASLYGGGINSIPNPFGGGSGGKGSSDNPWLSGARTAAGVGSLLTSGGQSDTMARAAEQSRTDEDQRQQRIAAASQKVNELFAPYGDDYYNKVSQDYEAYYAPELDRQYGETKGKLIADLSSRGVMDSSIAGKEQGDLARIYGDNQRTIKSQAQDYGRNWRNTVDGNRSNLLSLAESGAPLETVANAFSNMEGFMTEPPEYSPLGDLFSQYSGNLTNAQLVREARQSGLGFARAPSMGQNYSRKLFSTVND